MLRAPVLAAEAFNEVTGQTTPCPPAGAERARWLAREREDARRRLTGFVDMPRVALALQIASPSLVASLTRMRNGTLSGKKADRALSTLARYLTRMATRPTPYGLFAGVGFGIFGVGTTIALGDDPIQGTRTRADAAWLRAVVKGIEDDERLRDYLPVRPNSLLQLSAGRIILNRPNELSASRAVSIRLTAPVELALRLAEGEATYADLVTELEVGFPHAGTAKIRRMLARLWELNVIVSDVSPPNSNPHPELYLVKRLTGPDALTAVLEGLRRTHLLANRVDDIRGRGEVSRIEKLAVHQRGLTPGFRESTYQIDAALSLVGTDMTTAVGTAAAEMADILVRLGSAPRWSRHLASYRSVFGERYGVSAEIPILEVLSPELGIDMPNGYFSPPRRLPLPMYAEERGSARDQLLVGLVSEALYKRSIEVEITDRLLDALAVWRTDDFGNLPRPSLDIHCRIAAKSRQAIDEGRWRLVVSPGAYNGLQSFGRFFDLFDETAFAAFQDFADAEEALHPDIVFADLNIFTSAMRVANLTTHPVLRTYEICINTTPTLPPDQQIPLSDILVGVDSHGFYLRSARLGKRVVVGQGHAVNLAVTPNVGRALIELSTDGFVPMPHLFWDPVENSPFLPRLVRGMLVVSPAQWHVGPDVFSADTLSDANRFYEAVQCWRTEWRVPQHVYLAESDNRLLFDLDHPLWVDELRRDLRRAGQAGRPRTVRIVEMLPDFSDLWLRDRAGRSYHSELVIPVLANGSPTVSVHPRPVGPHEPVKRRFHPGEEWTFLKLYTSAVEQDDILTGPLPQLLAQLRADEAISGWFFVRYGDPHPHLRLRFHAAPTSDPSVLMARCASWARELIADRAASDMALATYERELERYGGPNTIEMIEKVFDANSQATIELLRVLYDDPELDPQFVCVYALHALYRSWGVDFTARIEAARKQTIPDSTHQIFRRLRSSLCGILAPEDFPQFAHTNTLNRIFPVQHDTLATAGSRIRRLANDAQLFGTEQSIVESLAHMQVNRLLGIDPHLEEQCYHLWQLALRAITHRPTARRKL